MALRADDIFSAGDSWTPTSPWVWYPHHFPDIYSGSVLNGLIEKSENEQKQFPEMKLKCDTPSSKLTREPTSWYKPKFQPPPFVKLITADDIDKSEPSSPQEQDKALEEMQGLQTEEDLTDQQYEAAVLEQIFGNLPTHTFLEEECQDDLINTAGWVETPCETPHPDDLHEQASGHQLDTYQPKILSEDDLELTDEVILTGDWGVTVKARDLITGRDLMVTFFHAVAGKHLQAIEVDLVVREAQIHAFVHDHSGGTPSVLGLILLQREGLVQYGLVQEFQNNLVKVPLSQVSCFSKEQLREHSLDLADSTWLTLFATLVKISDVLEEVGLSPSSTPWDAVYLQVQNGELAPVIVNYSISKHSYQSTSDITPSKDKPSTGSFTENNPAFCMKALGHHLQKLSTLLDRQHNLVSLCKKLTSEEKGTDFLYVIQKLNKMAKKALKIEQGSKILKRWKARKVRKMS